MYCTEQNCCKWCLGGSIIVCFSAVIIVWLIYAIIAILNQSYYDITSVCPKTTLWVLLLSQIVSVCLSGIGISTTTRNKIHKRPIHLRNTHVINAAIPTNPANPVNTDSISIDIGSTNRQDIMYQEDMSNKNSIIQPDFATIYETRSYKRFSMPILGIYIWGWIVINGACEKKLLNENDIYRLALYWIYYVTVVAVLFIIFCIIMCIKYCNDMF